MSVAHVFARTAARSQALTPLALSSSRVSSVRLSPVFNIMAPQRRKESSGSNVPNGYKEDHSKGAMLRFEDSLPKLPIPSLEETRKRYLKSVHPLLSSAEYEQTKKAFEEFVKPGGQGEELQKRLEARRNDPQQRNWLHEFWNEAAYLGDDGPVVPYVSYFYAHRDDRRRRDPAKRAASLTTAILDFKRQVDQGSLEPEYMRKEPMAMSSYWWMFNACRIPSSTVDYPVKYSYKENPYFIVMRKNQFWKVYHEVDGKQLNTTELEHQFRRVYENAEKAEAVGVMTAERRRIWAQMRDTLIGASPANKNTLEAIEASSFFVCLDDAKPVTLEERSHQYWHGDGCNRWFDKPLQFIVCDNGASGFMGEHSIMDGTPTHRLNDYVNNMVFNDKLDFTDASVRSNLTEPLLLKFTTTPQVTANIAQALEFHTTTIAQHELRVQAYQGYGKGLIKKFKCSPDAYVQMLIQLAYKKMYGKNRPTYESAMTRKFQQGRTEACRTVSDESVAFCDAMEDFSVPREKKVQALQAALKAHTQYTADAGAGHGVDRHLFGLSKMLKEGEDVPEVYKDPAYTYSSTWFISSSQLSSEYFNGYGWSQVVDDGWGIAYMINENSLQFNIVSKGLGSERMSFYINEAANDLRDILMPTLETPKSKL